MIVRSILVPVISSGVKSIGTSSNVAKWLNPGWLRVALSGLVMLESPHAGRAACSAGLALANKWPVCRQAADMNS